jgi:TDG/mug DNA glycosylase family protein
MMPRPPSRPSGLPTVVPEDPRILVLGSFPSRLSLERGEYFANPRNRFWSVVESLFGIPPDLPYQERARLLSSRGIALWDVVASCEREGSGDAAIREPVVNDIPEFLRVHPSIRVVVLNGRTAGRLFHRHIRAGIRPEITVMTLPSTSPANARFNLPRLVEKWRAILDDAEE